MVECDQYSRSYSCLSRNIDKMPMFTCNGIDATIILYAFIGQISFVILCYRIDCGQLGDISLLAGEVRS